MSKIHELTDKRFGKIVALRSTSERRGKQIVWLCQCDCGRLIREKSHSLASGQVQSCGCAHNMGNRKTKCFVIGGAKTPEYNVWRSMLNRCRNKHVKCYHRYGGRGIQVCERWNIFDNFLADMGRRPKGHRIERIDNDGNYEPSNCKWATQEEQCANKRNNRILTYNGVSKTLTCWAKELGLNRTTLRQRLVLGWDVETALTTQIRGAA